ncbi:hypothetical protein [Burkholderia gladioli]|uniref:hypothetical protein n=1 Tax=Burkholderia gladioli TaxID=28095 RepID=UPI003C7B455F
MIYGTHRDPRRMVADGAFRENLYAIGSTCGPTNRPIWPSDTRNLDFERDRFGHEQGEQVRANAEEKALPGIRRIAAGSMGEQFPRAVLRRSHDWGRVREATDPGRETTLAPGAS